MNNTLSNYSIRSIKRFSEYRSLNISLNLKRKTKRSISISTFHPEKKLFETKLLKLNFETTRIEIRLIRLARRSSFLPRIFTPPIVPINWEELEETRRNSETCNQRALQSHSFEERERERVSPPPPPLLLCNRESRFNPLHRLYTFRRLNALEREFRLVAVCFTLSRDDEETFVGQVSLDGFASTLRT